MNTGTRLVGGLDSTKQLDRRPDPSRLAPVQLLILTVLIVLGGVLFCGPNEGEVRGSLPGLVLYILVLGIAGAGALLARVAYGNHFNESGDDPLVTQPGQEFLADMALTGVLTVAAIVLCMLIFSHNHSAIVWLESVLYFGVLACCARLLRDKNARSAAGLTTVAATQPASADGQLPASELHYVEAEDHYVKLVFSDRVEHKRARFSDVIDSLGDVGLRVHKSFWVNRRFVTGTRRSGRRLVLVLKDGVEIPVGRSNERKVVDALALPQSPVPQPGADGIRPGPATPGT